MARSYKGNGGNLLLVLLLFVEAVRALGNALAGRPVAQSYFNHRFKTFDAGYAFFKPDLWFYLFPRAAYCSWVDSGLPGLPQGLK